MGGMVENKGKKLRMRFTPNTIEHLGVRMYSRLPPVISELIANAHDADAAEVRISLRDSEEKEIIIADNGHGMLFDEINQKFLVIGRNRRDEDETDISPGGRKVIGKKGLGKLSFFGIAHEIEITTVKVGRKNSFVMNWNDIMNAGNGEGGFEDYEPRLLVQDEETQENDGTSVTLRKIQRVTDFDAEKLADSISKYFTVQDGFAIKVSHNDGDWINISNERRYTATPAEIEWRVPKEVQFPKDCEYAEHISGHLLATEKPISPSTEMRGITLLSRGKLVNLPEYFSDHTSSHFFNYLTGWLEVDFIDDLDEDVISTDRQKLNWDHPEMKKLRVCLQGMLRWLERDWREKRNKKRQDKLNEDAEKKSGVTIEEWQKNVPEKIRKHLTPILEKVIGDSEFLSEDMVSTIKHLKHVLPPYTYYHYRSLHPTLSKAVFEYYKNKDYYGAVFEGVKKYMREVEKISGSNLSEHVLLENVFSDADKKPNDKRPKLSVLEKFKRPDGSQFNKKTMDSIKDGHRKLVIAMWEAFRNPLSHEQATDLRDSGLYTEQDCLDALSLLSHLFRRLDDAESV